MTDQQSQQNQDSAPQNGGRKRQFLLTKIVITISLGFFAYFGFKYWQVQQAKKAAAKTEVEKFDNVESEIFDLSGDYQVPQGVDPHELPDITVNELREKGAEFIYQMLIKNQVQINDLREQINGLKAEILKYKNQEKLGKMIFSYVAFRENLLAGKPYAEDLKNFEMLVSFDENLQNKTSKLKTLLPNFRAPKEMSSEFSHLIPDLIATKTNDPDTGLLGKIRHNISRLVVIRKVGEEGGDVDAIIAKTEKKLEEQNYQEALNLLLSLDQNYHAILVVFLTDLNNSIEVQKIDQEILNYLKNLS